MILTCIACSWTSFSAFGVLVGKKVGKREFAEQANREKLDGLVQRLDDLEREHHLAREQKP
jgi:hypothetical protein